VQKLEQEERDHGKANAALATAQTDRADAEKKIEALKAQLNEKATDHKLAKAESAALQREIDLLQAQLNRLQQAHDSQLADLDTLKKEKAELERSGDNKANKLDAELAQRKASLAELEKQLQSGKEQQQGVANELAEAKVKLDATNRASEQAAKEQGRLEQKIGLLEAKINAQEKELAEAQAQKKAGEARESKLSDQIAALKDDLNAKITDLKLATGQRDGLIKDVASLEKELSTLDTEAKKLKSSLEKSKDQHNDKIATLKASIADKEARAADGGLAIAKVEKLQKAKEAADKEHLAAMRSADEKISALTRDLDKLSVQAKLDADKNQGRIKELDGLLAAAIAEKQALAKENEKIQASVGDANDNEKHLLQRIEVLESELLMARKNASQSMMSRILELEAMLDAEKRKAEEHRAYNTMAEFGVAPSGTRRVAANTEITRKKKAS